MKHKVKHVELTAEQRALIDKELHSAAIIGSNIGTDSSKEELAIAHKAIKEHYEKIKQISPDFYKVICPDKEEKSNL